MQHAFFANWNLVCEAIDRAAGREHKIEHAVLPHRLHQNDRADDVVVVILEWLIYGLADGLVTGKMDHGVDWSHRKYLVQLNAVAQIKLHKLNLGCRVTGNSFKVVEHACERVAQVVHDRHGAS